MRTLILFAAICCFPASFTSVIQENPEFLSESMIQRINSQQTQWVAGRNFAPDTPKSEIRKLLGVNRSLAKKLVGKVKKVQHLKDVEIPESFDARESWFDCGSIKRISDQSACGSCWAVATADVMSDRVCIASSMKNQPKISSANIMQCCTDCGDGCDGGYPLFAWQYWMKTGVVTGGAYNSSTNGGCQNYPFPSCEHHKATGSRPTCPAEAYETPACTATCDNDSDSYESSLTFGSDAYMLDQDVEQIQLEIIKNGPVVADFDVYEDFLYYKSGVYQQTEGENDGGHSVRIIGWGTENDVDYWLVANSWNDNWGDQGLFKIIRGTNECGIEEDISAGLPKL